MELDSLTNLANFLENIPDNIWFCIGLIIIGFYLLATSDIISDYYNDTDDDN